VDVGERTASAMWSTRFYAYNYMIIVNWFSGLGLAG